MKYKILIVDDEKGLLTTMKIFFQMEGYTVYKASSGLEALEKIAHNPDIILLDINMPEMDGLTLCGKIREHITCPILFLTARVTSQDQIKGFRVGGDDYILKPFDLDELNARIAAHLRREKRIKVQSKIGVFGDLVIDYSKYTIFINKECIDLSKRQFDIVELLSMYPGQVFDKERIYENIWGFDGEGDSNTVKEHIRKIRQKFTAYTEHSYIETVWGIGYKWNI